MQSLQVKAIVSAVCVLSSSTMALPLYIWHHSFTHSFKYLQRLLAFTVSGNSTHTHQVPGHADSFLSHSSAPGSYPTSAKTINGHISLFLPLHFLFNTYGHSFSSSHHHPFPGLLKQPPTSHPLSTLSCLQPVLHVLQPEWAFTNSHLRMLLLPCLKPLMALHCLQDKA